MCVEREECVCVSVYFPLVSMFVKQCRRSKQVWACLMCCLLSLSLSGGSDAAEVRSSCDRAWFGARPLRAGAGPGSVLHDPEGPDQHRSAADQVAAAARVPAQRETNTVTRENQRHVTRV